MRKKVHETLNLTLEEVGAPPNEGEAPDDYGRGDPLGEVDVGVLGGGGLVGEVVVVVITVLGGGDIFDIKPEGEGKCGVNGQK